LDERQFKKEKNTMSAHGANLFPVFSEQGLEPTDLHGVAVEQDPATQTLRGRDFLTTAQPSMIWNDPAAEQQRRDAAVLTAIRTMNPERARLVEKRDQAARVVSQWRDAVGTLNEAVSSLRNLCQRQSVTYEDTVGLPREQRLAALIEQLEEARAELQAAGEELAAAEYAVEALVTV
jgi:hypothetical protein